MPEFLLQPRDEEGPVFAEPWQAQAFALVLSLHKQRVFSWDEWAGVLSDEIRLAQTKGDPDLGNTYYQHWLSALEKISITKGLTNKSDLNARKAKWHDAYLHTPHGQAIELSNSSQ